MGILITETAEHADLLLAEKKNDVDVKLVTQLRKEIPQNKTATRESAFKLSAMANPAASSAALLILKPDDKRSYEVLKRSVATPKLRCEVRDATLVRILIAIACSPWRKSYR